MMKKPDSQEPTKTINADNQWISLPEPLFAEEEHAQEGRFEEEGEHPFHRQRLAITPPEYLGELRPVGAELELHGDAGDDAEDEVDGEDLGPEARGAVVALVLFAAAPAS